jgi:hypothetical protein
MVRRRGFDVQRLESVGLPLDALSMEGPAARAIRRLDHVLSRLWPTMFGYQFIVEATAVRT